MRETLMTIGCLISAVGAMVTAVLIWRVSLRGEKAIENFTLRGLWICAGVVAVGFILVFSSENWTGLEKFSLLRP